METTMRPEANARAAADRLNRAILKDRPRCCPGTDAARLHKDLKSEKDAGRTKRQSISLLVVERASGEHAAMIGEWLDPTDLTYLGGDPGHPPQDQVRQWIDQALAAYVLLADHTPLAFFTIEYNSDYPRYRFLEFSENDAALEFGRLVIAPGRRRQGYGTSIFMHVYRSFLSCLSRDEPFHLLARQVYGNKICTTFFKKLPVRTLDAGSSTGYRWYISTDYNPGKHPGIEISARRRSAGLSQQKLAFLASMDTSTLAMIETGARVLRADDARRLRDILCDTPEEELHYAKDILACTFNPALWAYPSHLGEELSDVHQTLWIFSDILAENSTEDSIALSSQALMNKCDRVFFVPSDYKLTDIQIICQLFVLNFTKHQYDHNILSHGVRFYRAPDSLCRLRLAVHDPDPEPGSFGARKISIATGTMAMRLDIAHRGDPLVAHFLAQIKKQTLYTHLSQGPTSEGFERINIDEFLKLPNRLDGVR